jgi:transmembrane sensor
MKRSKADIIQLPNRERDREDASLWIVRLDRGLSDAERLELGAWLAGDPGRLEALASLAVVWDQADALAKYADVFPPSATAHPRFAGSGWRAAAAAVVGAAVIAGFVAFERTRDDATAPEQLRAQQTAPPQIYETSLGEQSTVRLSDGSLITLNTDSSIEVTYDDAQRSIQLGRGEGYFEVAHDPGRPFRVHAANRLIEAVGTAFNVRLGADNDVTMMVTEGKVSVQPRAPARTSADPARPPEAIVDAGSLAVMNEGPLTIQGLDPTEIGRQLSWRRGMLVFDGQPLESVLLEMSRYTTVELVPDDAVRNERVGGYFRAGDIDSLLVMLRDGFDIESERTADGRILLFSSAQPR